MVKEQSKSQNAVDLYDPTGEKGIPLIMRRAERSAFPIVRTRTHKNRAARRLPGFFAIPLILP